ncbi:hypothetical protein GCM10010214_28010 [Streptomyces abikoensis]|nr:hypothetical protein GCM10010214_28010 [Streptomyces abikoensis]
MGLCPKATRALTEFALTAPGVHTVFADVEPANPASVRVLEKAGFRRRAADEGEDTARFTITKPGHHER